MASDDDVRRQLVELSERIASLEAEVQNLRAAQPSGHAAEAATPTPPLRVRETKPREAASLESRIGAQLLNRIGILAVLIGVAWFLKLAFDRNWIGPPVRVWIGLGGRRRFGGMVRALSPPGIPGLFFQPEGPGHEHRVSLTLGSFQRFSSGSFLAYFPRHERGDRSRTPCLPGARIRSCWVFTRWPGAWLRLGCFR